MALDRKPVPHRLLDWKYLRPPNLEYAYFAAARSHPFRADRRSYCAGNATWLADAALLAYAPADFAIPQFGRAGLRMAQCIVGESTQVYLAEGDGFVLAAFRGTRIDHAMSFVMNMISNLRFALVPATSGVGQVHRGFQEALDETWAQIAPVLQTACASGRTVWLTGHSLGAALACLAAARLGDSARLMTFAGPRVGDADFAESLVASHLARFTYDGDLIPRIPPREMGFEHGLPRRLIQPDGQIRLGDDPVRDPELGGGANYARGVLQLNLFDHSPVLYAVHVYNALVDARGAR